MKVLIAIEESEYSMAALKSAAERNWNPDTEFCIISVVNFSHADASPTSDETSATHEKLVNQCRELVTKKAAEFRSAVGTGKKIEAKVLKGEVATAIINEANAWKADLIIVGSHGRKGFQRLLLGSVAETVANQATCSIEIVKGKVKP